MKIYTTSIWKWTNNKAIFFEGKLIRDESVSTFWRLRRRSQESKEFSTERCLQPSDLTETMEKRGSAVNEITRSRQVQNKHCTSWSKLQNEKLDHTLTAAWVRKTAESGVDYKSFRRSLVFSRFKISYALKHFLKSFCLQKQNLPLPSFQWKKFCFFFFLFCTCITSHRLKLELWLLESFLLFMYIYLHKTDESHWFDINTRRVSRSPTRWLARVWNLVLHISPRLLSLRDQTQSSLIYWESCF